MYWRTYYSPLRFVFILGLSLLIAKAQQPSVSPEALQRILDRLDSLEKQNDALLKEIHELRQELTGAQVPPLDERVGALEQHTKDEAQTKVSASQRFPISLTGMFLFNATASQGTSGAIYGTLPWGSALTGATLRQSIVGLDFYGPQLFGGGRIHGMLSMDFYAGSQQDSWLRLRRGVVSFDWRRRSITFGQDKPLISPSEPTSFARVGVPALSGAGNLWLWLPQARYEERIPLSANNTLKGQAAIIETNENYGYTSMGAPALAAPMRPGAEVRLEFQHSSNDQPKVTVGLGGHTSTSHVLGYSVPSRVVSFDFNYQPKNWLQLSGSLLHGENFANLGGLGPGLTVGEYNAGPVRANAGWIQIALPVTSRLTFDLYAGRQLNALHDLAASAPHGSLEYAGNVLYRIAPNVVLGFEGGALRFTYLRDVPYSTNRYDATVAYLF